MPLANQNNQSFAMPSPFSRPMALSRGGVNEALRAWSLYEKLTVDGLQNLQSVVDSEPAIDADVAYGVAVIPIHGMLVCHHTLFSELLGATSYADIRLWLQDALENPLAHSVVLDINSPGGEVDGCAELADAIKAARSIKPIEAYVGGTGASAAYWIASAAERITCAETALLGSIGVRLSMSDETRREAMEGIRSVEVISSMSPGKRDKPMDDEVIARAQAMVDELAAVFVRKVAENRGRTEGYVLSKFGQGDVVVGASAVSVGLADRLGSLDDLVEELCASVAPSPRRLLNR